MPHAELRGKIAKDGANLSDGLEDLLTSDIFGRLRYLSPELGLIPLLRAARSFKTGKVGFPIPGSVTGFDLEFWPRHSRSEPDVVIRLDTTCGPMYVIVECKYRSGKSSEDDSDGGPCSGQESADQLVRQFNDLVDMAGSDPGALLYITGHRVIPTAELERSALSAGGRRGLFRSRTYWLGWHTAWTVLSSLQVEDRRDKLVLKDMTDLLYHKGFRPFLGWPVLKHVLPLLSEGLWYRKTCIGWAPPSLMQCRTLPCWQYRSE